MVDNARWSHESPSAVILQTVLGNTIGSFVCFLRQGFSVALEPVFELALMDQAGLELTEIHLPLPPEYWD